MSETFGKHPSKKLQEIFQQRPFQIQEPEKAKVIFLSLDANFDENIEDNSSYFNETLRYLSDGVKYWESENAHTPMMKAYYHGGGKTYHRNFAKLGLTANNAKDICFMELLNVCTFGNSTKCRKEYNELLKLAEKEKHLERISNLAKDKTKLVVIVGAKTKEYIQKKDLFNLNADNIIQCKHFSDAISNEYLYNLGKTIKEYLLTH